MLIEEQAEQFAEMEKYNKISEELEKKIIELEKELNIEHLPYHKYCSGYGSVIDDLKSRLNNLMQIKNKRENMTYEDILKNALKPFKFSEGFVLPKDTNDELIGKINKYSEYIKINNNNSLKKVLNITLYSIKEYEKLSANDKIGELILLLNRLYEINFDFYINWNWHPPTECKTVEDFMERCKNMSRTTSTSEEKFKAYMFKAFIEQYAKKNDIAMSYYSDIIMQLAYDLTEQANKEEIRTAEIKLQIKKNVEEAQYFSNLLAKRINEQCTEKTYKNI